MFQRVTNTLDAAPTVSYKTNNQQQVENTMITLPGLYTDLSNEQYHSEKEWISSSQLAVASRSPAKFHEYEDCLNPNVRAKKKTDAMLLGTAIHSYILERPTFDQKYLVLPEDINLRTNAGKAIRDEMLIQAQSIHGGLVSSEEKETIIGMGNALEVQTIDFGTDEQPNVHKVIDLFKRGTAEESFFWVDADTGMKCRVRTDWRIKIESMGLIIDFKSARDADQVPFGYQMSDDYQWMRAAFYIDGVKAITGETYDYILLAQEKEPPYLAAAYHYEEHYIECGRALYKEKLRQIKKCRDTGIWPGYSNRLRTIEPTKKILDRHPEIAEVVYGDIPMNERYGKEY